MGHNTYTPDNWVIVEIESFSKEKKPFYRVFSGWYGGYAGCDSWKLSSGITKSFDCGTYYEIVNESGSTYICYKNNNKCSSYMSRMFNVLEEEMNKAAMTMEIIDYIPLLEETIKDNIDTLELK